MQQHLALRRRHQQRIMVRTTIASASEVHFAQLIIERIQRHRLWQLFLRQVPRRDTRHHLRRSEHVGTFGIAVVRPSFCRGRSHNPVSRSARRRSLINAHGHTQNVGGIRDQRNHSPLSLQNKRPALGHRRLCEQHSQKPRSQPPSQYLPHKSPLHRPPSSNKPWHIHLKRDLHLSSCHGHFHSHLIPP